VDLSPRSLGAHTLALGLVVAAGALSQWDIAAVAIAVVFAAFIVGGFAGGGVLIRALVYGGLVSVAVIAATAVPHSPLWSMPLATFGVWAGADFRRSLGEISDSHRS
jgi:hypothetical protein